MTFFYECLSKGQDLRSKSFMVVTLRLKVKQIKLNYFIGLCLAKTGLSKFNIIHTFKVKVMGL